jgi:ketosteroid isomerase-like protein
MNEAEKNAETVRRGYEAFNKADMQTLTELFDEGASWHTPGRSPIAGDHTQGTRSDLCPIRSVWG